MWCIWTHVLCQTSCVHSLLMRANKLEIATSHGLLACLAPQYDVHVYTCTCTCNFYPSYAYPQSEIQMKGEVAVRSQLLSAMAEQQNLMDALTAVSLLIACTHAHLCLLLLPTIGLKVVWVFIYTFLYTYSISCSYYCMCVFIYTSIAGFMNFCLHLLCIYMYIDSLKDVVKLQNENSSLKSEFQQLERNTTQQTERLEV